MANEMSNRKPYCFWVFTSTYAYQGWQETQHYREARLPSAGSFTFAGMHEVRRAAFRELARPEVRQVSIRTMQGRQVYRYFKQTDGIITGYYDNEPRTY